VLELESFLEDQKAYYRILLINVIFIVHLNNDIFQARYLYWFLWNHLANLAAMTNQQLIDSGRNQMDQTDEAIIRSKMVDY
jgi:hypothetical protein